MALKVQVPFPFRAVILTYSRIAVLTHNSGCSFVRRVIDACHAVEDAGRLLHLECTPSHIGQRRNDRDHSLATEADYDNASSIFIAKFAGSRQITRRTLVFRYFDPLVTMGTLLRPFSYRGMSRVDVSLLLLLRCHSELTRTVPHCSCRTHYKRCDVFDCSEDLHYTARMSGIRESQETFPCFASSHKTFLPEGIRHPFSKIKIVIME